MNVKAIVERHDAVLNNYLQLVGESPRRPD